MSNLVYRYGLLLFLLFLSDTHGATVQLTSENLGDFLASTEVVFINFYVEGCQFSKVLGSIYEDMAAEIQRDYSAEKVVFGKIDGRQQAELAHLYKIKKYPTLRMFRFGEQVKREYRGLRSVESLVHFVRHELEDPVRTLSSANEMLNNSDKYTIGYFESPESSEYEVYRRVASVLRDDCQFYVVFRKSLLEHETDVVHFTTAEKQNSLSYSGRIGDYNELLEWSKDNCIQFVREVTFENAEELTEEGLPMVILFHHPTDLETPLRFRKFVTTELRSERHEIIFLTANGLKFSHPLEHLGRTIKDLPVIAIDTFKHMYLWQHNPKTDISEPGLIKQFIADLYSGKLHREFHKNDLRPTKATPQVAAQQENLSRHVVKDSSTALHHHHHRSQDDGESTSPPKSTFIKLAPSRARYTLVRDEL